MIYYTGNHLPLKSQVKEAWMDGDDSFTAPSCEDFKANIPCFLGLAPCHNILIKTRHVEPHTDPWGSWGNNEPCESKRRSIFWLLRGELIVAVGNAYRRMSAGDYIVFNDSIVHSVHAPKTWAGASWQLKTKQKLINDLGILEGVHD